MALERIGWVACIAFLVCSCTSLPAETRSQCRVYLDALASEGPEEKAEATVASGTPYLLGVRGFTVSFPGVEEAAAGKFDVRIMEGTSDAFLDDTCRLYQRRAEKYARRFNRRVLKLIAKSAAMSR